MRFLPWNSFPIVRLLVLCELPGLQGRTGDVCGEVQSDPGADVQSRKFSNIGFSSLSDGWQFANCLYHKVEPKSSGTTSNRTRFIDRSSQCHQTSSIAFPLICCMYSFNMPLGNFPPPSKSLIWISFLSRIFHKFICPSWEVVQS